MNDKEMTGFISNAPIKDTTKRAYKADLATIVKYTGESLYNTVMQPSTFIPVIYLKAFEQRRVKSKGALGTRKTLVKTVLALLKHSGLKIKHNDVFGIWYKHFMELSTALDTFQDNNVQTESSITWKDVKQRFEEAKYGSLGHTTLALYTLIPPRRQQDYWKLRVRGEMVDGDTGVIDMNSKTIVVHVFKTVDKYDKWTKKLPEELFNVIRDYISKDTFNSEYLFSKRDGKPYSSLYSFTDANNTVIKQVLKNPRTSVNSIRHAAATFINGDRYMLRKDKKQYAYDMAHSFSMQSLYVEALEEMPENSY
jgi:integrase